MANYKIEIIGSAVVITDTTAGKVHAEFPRRDIYYTVQKLIDNGVVYLYDTNGTNQGASATAFEAPLADCVDGDDVAFTIASFRTFAQENLGFNIGGSPAGSGAAAFKFTAVNYTDLITNVAPTADEGDLAFVYNSQGIWAINRKLKGMWQYQTGAWVYANQELQTILQDKLDNVTAGTGISINYTNPLEPLISFNGSISGSFILDSVVSPAALVAATHNWIVAGLATANVIYATSTGNNDLTGIDSTGIVNGQTYFIYNIGVAGDIKIKNNNAGSLAANRIITNGDVNVKVGMGVILSYDTTASRWRVNYFK